jgi:hypothetical protein
VIGYAVQVKVWSGEGEDPEYATAILSLDLDAVETEGKPTLDLRLAGGDVILNAAVSDAYEAIRDLSSQLSQWKRDQEAASDD